MNSHAETGTRVTKAASKQNSDEMARAEVMENSRTGVCVGVCVCVPSVESEL